MCHSWLCTSRFDSIDFHWLRHVQIHEHIAFTQVLLKLPRWFGAGSGINVFWWICEHIMVGLGTSACDNGTPSIMADLWRSWYAWLQHVGWTGRLHRFSWLDGSCHATKMERSHMLGRPLIGSNTFIWYFFNRDKYKVCKKNLWQGPWNWPCNFSKMPSSPGGHNVGKPLATLSLMLSPKAMVQRTWRRAYKDNFFEFLGDFAERGGMWGSYSWGRWPKLPPWKLFLTWHEHPQFARTGFIIELSQQLFEDYTVEISNFLQFRLWIVQFILKLDELSQLLDQTFIPIQLNALSFADFADVFPIFLHVKNTTQ